MNLSFGIINEFRGVFYSSIIPKEEIDKALSENKLEEMIKHHTLQTEISLRECLEEYKENGQLSD